MKRNIPCTVETANSQPQMRHEKKEIILCTLPDVLLSHKWTRDI